MQRTTFQVDKQFASNHHETCAIYDSKKDDQVIKP
jgi:hypothetical protein